MSPRRLSTLAEPRSSKREGRGGGSTGTDCARHTYRRLRNPPVLYHAYVLFSPGSVAASRISWLLMIVSISATVSELSLHPEQSGYGNTAYLISVPL